MKIFVDIDETICEHLGERLGYKDPTPLMQNIEKINKLYEEGNDKTKRIEEI